VRRFLDASRVHSVWTGRLLPRHGLRAFQPRPRWWLERAVALDQVFGASRGSTPLALISARIARRIGSGSRCQIATIRARSGTSAGAYGVFPFTQALHSAQFTESDPRFPKPLEFPRVPLGRRPLGTLARPCRDRRWPWSNQRREEVLTDLRLRYRRTKKAMFRE
jgi:hypothetical protein